MRHSLATSLLMVVAASGCLPLVTTGARTYEEGAGLLIGASLPVPLVRQYGAPSRSVFLELTVEGSSPDDEDLLAQWCVGLGSYRNYGPVARSQDVWEGVSAGVARLSLADSSTAGFYVAAGTFNAAWGGILLRYTFAPDLDGTTGTWGTRGATIAYWWGWLPSMIFLEAAGS